MRMRAVTGGLELPPRQPVELKSGGYHVMLIDLKKALVAGETVPLTLEFVDPCRSQGGGCGWTCRCAPPPRARATRPRRRIATEARFAAGPRGAGRRSIMRHEHPDRRVRRRPADRRQRQIGRRVVSGARLAQRGGDRARAAPEGPRRVRRPGQGARAARDLHRRGEEARRGDGPRAAVRPARPGQDDAVATSSPTSSASTCARPRGRCSKSPRTWRRS